MDNQSIDDIIEDVEEISPFEEDIINPLKIDFITQKSQKKMKVSLVDLIVDHVRNGRILVLEGGIDSPTELKLIEKSMAEIDHERFLGLEIKQSLASGKRSRKENKYTIIAPASCDVSFRTI